MQRKREVEHWSVSWEELLTEAKCLSLPTRRLEVSTTKVNVGKDVATLIERRARVVDAESRFSTRRLGTVRAGRTHRGEGDVPTTTLPIVVREADGRAGERSAIGVIEAWFAEFAGSFASSETMDTHVSGVARSRTSKISTAVSVHVAALCATLLRFVGHRDALVGNATRTIEVRFTRGAFVSLQTSLLQDAALSFEQRLAVAEVCCRDTRRVDRHFAAQVVVALLRHAVADLARISRDAAVITPRAVRVGFAIVLGAIRVRVRVALRDARQRRRAFCRGAREIRARRSIGTFAHVAVFARETGRFIELAGVSSASALRQVTTLTRRAARKSRRAFLTKRTLESNAPILAVGLTRERVPIRAVLFGGCAILRPIVVTIGVRVAFENAAVIDADVSRKALRRVAFAFACAVGGHDSANTKGRLWRFTPSNSSQHREGEKRKSGQEAQRHGPSATRGRREMFVQHPDLGLGDHPPARIDAPSLHSAHAFRIKIHWTRKRFSTHVAP